MKRSYPVRLVGLLVLGVLGGLAGCDAPQASGPARVRGTVYFQNRPLTGGLIVFSPDIEKGTTGAALKATIGEQGEYLIEVDQKTAKVGGWYRVAIAEPPGLFTTELGYPEFPKALRRPDRSGLEREIVVNADNHFHFHIEIPD